MLHAMRKTKRKTKNEKEKEKMGRHVMKSVIHACEESNRRHSYIKRKKRINKSDLLWKKSQFKKKLSRSLLLEPVGTAEIGENAHQVALMLLYVEKQM